MKAIVLLSGGLDSALALKMIMVQNIEAVALHFVSPFCLCDGAKGCGSHAKRISDQLGSAYRTVFLGEEYLAMVKSPRHGYGRNLNPCIDCRIMKFRRAKDVMDETGAAFIVTGEVLGQRPMSQHKRAMSVIDRESGLYDLVVRPLSAKVLEPSLPEREGWVDRSAFLDIQGRTRKPQLAWAEKFGINDYACPAGGCLLTDRSFSGRLKDLMTKGPLDLSNVALLRVGRHFRLSECAKLIVGRDEKENQRLLNSAREGDMVFEPVSRPGPAGLGRGIFDDELKALSLRIIARYTAPGEKIEVRMARDGQETVASAEAAAESEMEAVRI